MLESFLEPETVAENKPQNLLVQLQGFEQTPDAPDLVDEPPEASPIKSRQPLPAVTMAEVVQRKFPPVTQALLDVGVDYPRIDFRRGTGAGRTVQPHRPPADFRRPRARAAVRDVGRCHE